MSSDRIKRNTAVQLRCMIEALREDGPLTSADVSVILSCSISGARKQLARLREAGLLVERVVTMPGRVGQVFYFTLVPDAQKVKNFTESLDGTILTPEQKSRRLAARKRMLTALTNFSIGTMVHEMMDELGAKPRIVQNAKVRVQRDPLIAALFGPAKPQ
jgi:predicted transcriptional regulator